MGHIDSQRLGQSLESLRAQDPEQDLADSMDALVAGAQSVFPVAGAGLMLADEDRALRYVAATDAAARVLEEAQEEAGTGPCVEALVRDELIQTADVRADPRWPGLLDEHPDATIRAVLGVPLRVAAVPVGSLNVYSADPFDWDETDRSALTAFADLAGNVLVGGLRLQDQHRLVKQLESALESRVMIERAVGMLMEREGVDAMAAFELLRGAARDSRRRVRDLAQALIEFQDRDR